MAAAAGSLLNPSPGTLSNAAASARGAGSYGVGFIFGSAIAPIGFSFARASSSSGVVEASTRTPICSGSVQPAAS